MNVKILRTFVYDKVFYAAEQEVDFEKEQVEYLNSTSLGKIVEVIEGNISDEETNLSEKDYEKLKKKKLVEIARMKDIQVDENMTKKEIIEELL